MRFSLLIIVLSFCFALIVQAQSDTIVITLKDSTVKISVSQIQKIQFENDTIVGVHSEVTNNYSI
ncbi:MAG: hypothetical protein A2X61_04850 [Ignavibacteria bacterium GWB2_35_12]|nr:MAG: hypothetical protein A2X61_04850 [Ignavibacteria bacterium GWB2_35_12]OGU94323.1 MAG: hypothetical protein A2220_17270 [Ignavibacteria bacterium RIFOXYA2_FULL_35_10]OGV23835.1 MAG: hypothetical protein A2475_00075 [Ignavibacteria bacterium RIFOXYC2_FULL_35_21]